MLEEGFLEELSDAEMESHWFWCIGNYNTCNDVISRMLVRWPFEVVEINFDKMRRATTMLEEAQVEMSRRTREQTLREDGEG